MLAVAAEPSAGSDQAPRSLAFVSGFGRCVRLEVLLCDRGASVLLVLGTVPSRYVGLVASGSWRVSSGRAVLEQEQGRVSDRSSVLPARAVRNRGALFLLCSSARHERR